MITTRTQIEAIRVLMSLEPKDRHEEKCPAYKGLSACTCYLIRNTKLRVSALDEAGMLCDPQNEILRCDPKEMDITR